MVVSFLLALIIASYTYKFPVKKTETLKAAESDSKKKRDKFFKSISNSGKTGSTSVGLDGIIYENQVAGEPE